LRVSGLLQATLASHLGGSFGDHGLMDQQAALPWVRANMRQFGGKS
jgi:carboxylesterase type B